MAYVGFDNHGYKYFDEGNYLLFSENNAHEHLFDYVAQDLSCLPELFGQYVSRRMDTLTFTLYDCPDNDTLIDQIKNVLIAAHPYYKHKFKAVLIRAIGDYFNKLLLYSCYHQHIAIPDSSKTWYIQRITALLNPLLVLGDTYPQDFYNEYQKQIGGDAYNAELPDTEIERFVYGVPQEMPTGLSNELRTQREIYNMLYFLLDISAAYGLDELTTSQRIWLYSSIMANGKVGIAVPKQLSLKRPTIYCNGSDYSELAKYNRELDDKFRPLYILRKTNVGRDGIPAGMEENIRSAIDYAKTAATTELYETYEIGNLYQLLCLEVQAMVRDKVKIRKCRHCGKYFVAATRRIVYCDRVDESGVRCSAVGYQEAFQKKMADDEPLQLYQRAYKTHHARVRKGKMTKDAFQLWCNEAKAMMEKARSGNLDIDTYQKWLKK